MGGGDRMESVYFIVSTIKNFLKCDNRGKRNLPRTRCVTKRINDRLHLANYIYI